MVDDILQRFLTDKLFDVGGDDTRLDRLRAAATELSVSLKAAPERVAAFTMVAIDPDIGPDEPVLAEVAAILQKHWNSYAGAFVDSTLPVIFRGIILNALASLINSEAIAAAVAMTARNLLPRRAAKSDEPLWNHLINAAGHRLELRARREWALPSAASAQQHELSLTDIGAITRATANKDWLTNQLRIASGPNSGGEATNGNPHFPSANEAWVQEFGDRAATAIVGSINGAIKALVENVNAQMGLKAQAEAIEAYVQSVIGEIAQTALGLERRTTLLWWKEALYSPAGSRSYRDLDLPVAAAFAAIDVSVQTGPFAPRMAEAFLLEAVRAIDPDATQTPVPLTDLCGALASAPQDVRDLLLQALSHVHVEPGRTPLAGLIGAGSPIDGAAIAGRIGLKPDATMNPAEFSLWLFRDLQASAATPVAKGRKRKAT